MYYCNKMNIYSIALIIRIITQIQINFFNMRTWHQTYIFTEYSEINQCAISQNLLLQRWLYLRHTFTTYLPLAVQRNIQNSLTIQRRTNYGQHSYSHTLTFKRRKILTTIHVYRHDLLAMSNEEASLQDILVILNRLNCPKIMNTFFFGNTLVCYPQRKGLRCLPKPFM